MNKNEKTYIVLSESVAGSAIKDVFALMFLAAKKSGQCFEGTREEAIKFLSESEK